MRSTRYAAAATEPDLPEFEPPYRRRIGLLGGSFNPPHAGHREISLAALKRLKLDAVWWIVTPGSPLKDENLYAPYEARLAKARRTANHEDIVISDFEQRHNLQYTVDTIERLQFLNPSIRFVWIMGADSFAEFHRWKDWHRIAELAPLAVFNRPGYREEALSGEAAALLKPMRRDETEAATLPDLEPPCWIYFSETDNPLSSTAIRNAKTSGEDPTT